MKEIIKEGKNGFPFTMQFLISERLGFIQIDDICTKKSVIYQSVPSDLSESINPYLDSAIAAKEKNHEGLMECALNGLLNMVGSISLERIIDILSLLLPMKEKAITDDSILGFVNHSILVRRLCDATEDGKILRLVTDLVEREAWIYEVRHEVGPFIPKDIEDILAHGTFPFLTPYRQCEKNFYALLLRNEGKDHADFNYTRYYQQFQDSYFDAVKLFKEFSQYHTFKSEKELTRALEAFQEMNNGIPRFFLKGWSSNEVLRQKESRTFSPLPLDIGQTKTPPPPSGLKIGRNDPCPCGSGKKFKNCCGRYS